MKTYVVAIYLGIKQDDLVEIGVCYYESVLKDTMKSEKTLKGVYEI